MVISERDVGDIMVRHGAILSGGCVSGKVPERLPGSWQVAFALVEVKGLAGGGVRFRRPGRPRPGRERDRAGCRRARSAGRSVRRAPPPSGRVPRLRDDGPGRRESWRTVPGRWPGWTDPRRPPASWLMAINSMASSYRLGPCAAMALASFAAVVARRRRSPIWSEGVVFEPKILLRGRWIAAEHRDEGGGLGHRRRHRGTEGVQQGFRAV